MDKETAVRTGRDLFTQGRVRSFRKCPRHHYLRFEVGLVEEGQKKALRMGSAFHVGMEALSRIPGNLEGDARDQATDEAILAALVDYNEGPPSGVDPLEWAIEKETVGRMLQGYSWRWQKERIEIVTTERPFKLPIKNVETGHDMFKVLPQKVGPPKRLPLYRAGVIDKMVKVPDGRTGIQEHKTTGESLAGESDYWKQAKMSPQVTYYYTAAQQSDDLPNPEGIWYDVIRKPSIEPKLLTQQETRDFLGLAYRKGKKQIVQPDADAIHQYHGEDFQVAVKGTIDNENPDNTKIEKVIVDGHVASMHEDGRLRETVTMYGARLMADMLERHEFYFARQEIPRLQDDIEEFQADIHQTVEMVLFCQRTGRWPKNPDSCLYPFRCEYFKLCSNNVQVTINGEPPKGYTILDYVHPELEGKL